MFARINFLLALAAVAAIVFYLLGRYFVVAPVAATAPQWASYAAGVVTLVALMLIVLTLAAAIRGLEHVTNAARRQPVGPTGYAGQISIVLAHLLSGACIYRAPASTSAGAGIETWALVIVLYSAGAGAAFVDWRKRAAAGGQ